MHHITKKCLYSLTCSSWKTYGDGSDELRGPEVAFWHIFHVASDSMCVDQIHVAICMNFFDYIGMLHVLRARSIALLGHFGHCLGVVLVGPIPGLIANTRIKKNEQMGVALASSVRKARWVKRKLHRPCATADEPWNSERRTHTWKEAVGEELAADYRP